MEFSGINMNNNVVVFDGICNLCSWGVKFIIRRDYKNKFLFTPMQSKIGPQLLVNHGIQTENTETFLLIKDGKPYTKSDAVFEIVAEFKPAWKILFIFRFFPKAIRDFAYGVIAKNRYKLFGRKDQCMIPSPDIKAKFLD
jgi:predicted DCC family thiol-disulfide oxidoreductase YuxK